MNSTTTRQVIGIKFPQIRLAKFSGDYSQFNKFWSNFHALVHSQTHLSKSEKFLYLLDNDIQHVINNLPVTDDNYDVAIDIIQTRLGDKNILVNSLIADLSKLPNPNTHPVCRLGGILFQTRFNFQIIQFGSYSQ